MSLKTILTYRKKLMTTLSAAPVDIKLPPVGNWTRYTVTVKDHEDWVLESNPNWRSDAWWEMDFNGSPKQRTNHWSCTTHGWIKIDKQDAVNFEGWESPFFVEPCEIYKLLRACMRRHNSGYGTVPIDGEQQKEAWAWCFDNLIVHKITFNLHTLTGTKEEIDFKKECCPRNISTVY